MEGRSSTNSGPTVDRMRGISHPAERCFYFLNSFEFIAEAFLNAEELTVLKSSFYCGVMIKILRAKCLPPLEKLIDRHKKESKIKNQSDYQLPTRDHPRTRAFPRALFFPQRPEMLPYHIIDISKGGLSFKYLGVKIKRTGTFSVSLYHENELIAKNLPAKEASDILLQNGFVPVRHASICLESPSSEQQSRLSTFIQNFTEFSPRADS